MTVAPQPGLAPSPRIWFLHSEKMGDNAQVFAILEAVGLPWETKRLFVRPEFQIDNPKFAVSLAHLDAARSDRLEPPWPDLVASSGRRMAMAALWIKEQSGGQSKILYVGRPRKWIGQFDLVIGPAQYRLPPAPNVLRLDLPLMRPDRAAVAAAEREWAPRLAGLRRPLIAVLVGGQTKPFRFDAEVASQLVKSAVGEAGRSGGSLYFTTSRRTPADVAERIERELPAGAKLFRWRPGAADNPYFGLLAHADRFIVTGDSASMMIEVIRLGKPLLIFPQPVRRELRDLPEQLIGTLLHVPAGEERRWWRRLLRPLGDLLYTKANFQYSRDLRALHRILIERGLASRIGARPVSPVPIADELTAVAERVRQLLGQTG